MESIAILILIIILSFLFYKFKIESMKVSILLSEKINKLGADMDYIHRVARGNNNSISLLEKHLKIEKKVTPETITYVKK